jgi:Fur family ferric uptake transcriptional regulator
MPRAAAGPHKSRYSRAHARLTRHMRGHGLKLTRQREIILEAFLAAPRHVPVEELLGTVRQKDGGIGHATVYRTMKLFVEAGIASERHFSDGPTQYEPQADGHEHHDHLICTSCGRIVEFENEEIERLQEAVARGHGFTLTHHKMELYGVCAECRSGGGQD